VLAAAVTILIVTLLPDPPPDVIVWWDGRGDGSFGDVIGAGVDAARESNPDLVIVERFEHSSRADEIEKQVSLGTPLVILEWAEFGFTREMVVDNPETEFVFIDCTEDLYFWFEAEDGEIPPNMSCIFSANVEMGFLAGAAAAMASDTGTVGFVGGADIQVIWQFQTGFEQGVAYVDSSVDIVSVYLSGWNEIRGDDSGFRSPTMAEAAARHLHALGADVVFAPAGFSVWGAIDWAAKIARDEGANVWSIGVDSDQWVEAPVFGEKIGMDLDKIELVQSRILTSVVKRLDVGIEASISTFFETGEVNDLVLTVQNEGVGYTTSGGHLTPWTDRMDDALNAIIKGEVVVANDRETDIVYFFDVLLP
jgi:basic membrane protein A